MPQPEREINLTPPFMRSAERLCKSNRRWAMRIAATLNELQTHADLPGLHHEHIKDTPWTAELYSCKVNGDVRLLEDESRWPTVSAMRVDHHDRAYNWASRYHGGKADEIVGTWRGYLPEAEDQFNPAESRRQTAQVSSSHELLKNLGPADPGEGDCSCIPVDELCKLELTVEEAERIRQASVDALLNGYVSDKLANEILELYYEYLPVAAEELSEELQEADAYTSITLDEFTHAVSAPMPIPLDPAADGITITSNVGERFLHMVEMGLDRYLTTITPEQQALAQMEQQRLLVIQGSGGSGKTTVAIHRLRYLADRIATQPQLLASGERRVIYLCFNRTLAEVASQMIDTLYNGQAPSTVEVFNVDHWAHGYLERRGILHGKDGHEQTQLVNFVANRMKSGADFGPLTPRFVTEEIRYVIIGRGISRLDDYLSVAREGRKAGLRESERRLVWRLYEERLEFLRKRNTIGVEMYVAVALSVLAEDQTFAPYDAVVIDEAQDFAPIALRLARLMAGNQPARISVFGDAAQSIYPSGFSWSLPVLSPRSRERYRLTRNHRNTAQIYELADALLGHGVGPQEPEDYVTADRPTSTGPLPVLVTCLDRRTELSEVTARIRRQLDGSAFPQTIGVLCGTRKDKDEMGVALDMAGIPVEVQGESGQNRIHITQPSVKVLTMHSAKGLDFPHVYLVGLTNNGLPGTRHDLPGADPYSYGLEQQRRLLYTSMIRAGQTLVMTTLAGDEHALIADLRGDLCCEEQSVAQ